MFQILLYKELNKFIQDNIFVKLGDSHFFVLAVRQPLSIYWLLVQIKQKNIFWSKLKGQYNILMKNAITSPFTTSNYSNIFLNYYAFSKLYLNRNNNILSSTNFSTPHLYDLLKKRVTYILKGRSAFASIFFSRAIYSFKLSKYIQNLKKLNLYSILVKFFYSIKNLLVCLEFIFSCTDAFYFLKNDYVWINRKKINHNKVLCKNDVLELVMLENYFYYLTFFNFFRDKFIYKWKTRRGGGRNSNIFGEKSGSMLNFFFSKYNVSFSLEWDYFTLTIFCLTTIVHQYLWFYKFFMFFSLLRITSLNWYWLS